MSEKELRALQDAEDYVRTLVRGVSGRPSVTRLTKDLGVALRENKVAAGSAVWHRAMGYLRGYLDGRALECPEPRLHLEK